MSKQGSLFVARLIADNVIKPSLTPGSGRERLDDAGDVAHQDSSSMLGILTKLSSPDLVRIDEAGGGFGTVVEIAADYCKKIVRSSIGIGWIKLDGNAIATMLAKSQDPFASELLNELAATGIGLQTFYATNFQLTKLSFEGEHSVILTLQADVVAQVDLPQPPNAYDNNQFPQPGDPAINPGTVVTGRAMHFAAVRSAARWAPVHPARLLAAPRQAPQVQSGALPAEWNFAGDTFLASGTVGLLRIQIKCPYTHVTDKVQCCASVNATLSKATVTILNKDDDVARLANGGAFGKSLSILKTAVLHQPDLSLIPKISIVGPAPMNEPPTEFDRFDVHAFHVTEPAGILQALVIAIDVKPGHHGVVGSVTHFIGRSDFGIISDEYRTERLFKYKWRIGGFLRQFPLSEPIKVAVDGDLQNATMHGRLDLDSLQVVSFEIDANSDADVVKIGGRASLHVDYLELRDGRRIDHPDAQHVNFGSPKILPWNLVSAFRLKPIQPAEPLLRQFQESATETAFQYIGRPFAEITDQEAMITYVRLQSVSKQVFMRGTFNTVFR